MPITRTVAACRLYAASILCLALAPAGQASLRASGPADPAANAITCEFPVRLTRDCSIWQGATRPVAIGDYRMTLAADRAGRTVLVTQLRPGPSHNGSEFRLGPDRRWLHHSSAEAIRLIGEALEDRGIRLERTLPVRRGRGIQAYFLEFSDDAYEVLKQFTVLESEHWLPPQRGVR
jgi:hypothetical protein